MIGRPEDIRSYRIVISSEVEKSFSFAVWKRMFGNSKRETCYSQCFRASPHIYSRRSRHHKFESRNRASSIPFLWKGNARRARGWSRERKVPSQPPPLRGTSFQRKEGKQRSDIAYLYSAAFRSFDSVLLFQIIHFLTYNVFLRSG